MKKMIKGFLVFLCMVSVFMLIPAQSKAVPLLKDWTFDMTYFNTLNLVTPGFDQDTNTAITGFGKWTGLDQLNFDTGAYLPNTFIKQNLGSSGMFQLDDGYWIADGMTFEEAVHLQLSSGSPGSAGIAQLLPQFIDFDNPENSEMLYHVILGAEELTGSISNLTLDGTQLTWDYTFDPGGKIGFYLMDNDAYEDYYLNFDYTGYTGTQDPFQYTLLELEIIPVSGGTAPGYIGGQFDGNSVFAVSFQVTDAMDGMFLSSTGEDLWDLFGTIGWLLASQSGETGIQGAPEFFTDQDGNKFFTITGNTGDKFQLAVIPEPTTWLLFGTGLLGLAFLGRRRLMNK